MQETHLESAEIIRRAWPDWEIRDTIGTGAFATVYRASRRERIAGEKDSAIKVIRIPHDDTDWDRMLAEGKTPEQAEAFFQGVVDDSLKEIRAMEELSGHTNIVNILDYKRYHVPDRHVWYILIRMELLQKVDTGKLDEKEIIRLGTDVCTALSICRKKNIVHRDVSLDNIFIHDGSYKLGDFGVAKVLEGTLGGLQSIAGKPLYMAPEIYNATLTETDMDSAARVDIYSLGILLYRLTHHMNYPFEDPDTPNISASERSAAFRRRVIEGEELPPPKYASPELAAIILKASMANPSRRYDNVEDMRADLQALTAADTPPASGRKKKVPGKRLSPKKKILLTAAAVLLLLLITAGIWFLTRPADTDPEQPEAPAEVPGLDTGMYHIILTARDMGIKNFYDTRDLLEARLDIFTKDLGGYQSSANEREGRIDLLIPRKAFDGMKVENVLRACLVRPTILYAMNQRNHNSYIEIGRNDMESVTVMNGIIDGVDPADYGIDFSSGPYLEIVLTDEFASLHRTEMDSWDKLIFVLDYEQYRNDTWHYFENILPAGDGKTYYLIPTDITEQFSELLCHNLKNTPLPDAMDYIIDLNYLTVWQNTEDTARPGLYQCNYPDVPEESVTIQFRNYHRLLEGATLDAENELKARLDLLETPYAFGIAYGNQNTYFSVKIPSSRMGRSLMAALVSYNLSFRSGMLEYDCYWNDLTIDFENDSFGFTLIPEEKPAEYIRTLADHAAQEDGYLYLYFGNDPLFAAKADTLREDGSFRVDYYCEVQEGHPAVNPLDSDLVWLRFFVQGLSKRTESLSGFSVSDWHINTAEGEAIPSVPSFAIPYDIDISGLEKAVKDICPTAHIHYTNSALSSSLDVYLNLPMDETLPEKLPAIARDIYEAIDFPTFAANYLFIYIFNTEYPYDAYISFFKRTRSISSTFEDDRGYIYAAGSFTNEKLAPWKEKLVEVIESMDFYRELTHKDTEWTITKGQQNE